MILREEGWAGHCHCGFGLTYPTLDIKHPVFSLLKLKKTLVLDYFLQTSTVKRAFIAVNTIQFLPFGELHSIIHCQEVIISAARGHATQSSGFVYVNMT